MKKCALRGVATKGTIPQSLKQFKIQMPQGVSGLYIILRVQVLRVTCILSAKPRFRSYGEAGSRVGANIRIPELKIK